MPQSCQTSSYLFTRYLHIYTHMAHFLQVSLFKCALVGVQVWARSSLVHLYKIRTSPTLPCPQYYLLLMLCFIFFLSSITIWCIIYFLSFPPIHYNVSSMRTVNSSVLFNPLCPEQYLEHNRYSKNFFTEWINISKYIFIFISLSHDSVLFLSGQIFI